MRTVKLQTEYMIKDPLNAIGLYAGTCWNANTKITANNIIRALECINSGHGRVTEIPEIYCIIDGYSAKCIRELYTHIGGNPTRLQASTRYIDYSNPKKFNLVKPNTVANNIEANSLWDTYANTSRTTIAKLISLGIPVEDATMCLPIAYESKMIWKVNLRTLINFMNMRLCTRAYWEIRLLARQICTELSNVSDEWKQIVEMLFVPKCKAVGYCTEAKTCKLMPSKNDVLEAYNSYNELVKMYGSDTIKEAIKNKKETSSN